MVNLVTAVIKPHKLEEVKDAFEGIGIQGITVDEVKGFGRQGGHTETYRGAEYTRRSSCPRSGSRSSATRATPTSVVDAIVAAAKTDKIGDGKIWVTPVDQPGAHPHRRAGRGGAVSLRDPLIEIGSRREP